MPKAAAAALILTGLATTAIVVARAFGASDDAVIALAALQIGPAWALAFCLVSDESDFGGASRSRSEWLRLLPWTFLLAPLVLPNLVLLASFFRDSRADGGRTALSWDRMRPGDEHHDHHWPG